MGVDLPGEKDGLIPDPRWKESVKGENWYIGDTYNISIGQGDIAVTPLQVTAAVAAIANGGTLYQPKFVKKIAEPSGKSDEQEEKFEEELLGHESLNTTHIYTRVEISQLKKVHAKYHPREKF